MYPKEVTTLFETTSIPSFQNKIPKRHLFSTRLLWDVIIINYPQQYLANHVYRQTGVCLPLILANHVYRQTGVCIPLILGLPRHQTSTMHRKLRLKARKSNRKIQNFIIHWDLCWWEVTSFLYIKARLMWKIGQKSEKKKNFCFWYQKLL